VTGGFLQITPDNLSHTIYSKRFPLWPVVTGEFYNINVRFRITSWSSGGTLTFRALTVDADWPLGASIESDESVSILNLDTLDPDIWLEYNGAVRIKNNPKDKPQLPFAVFSVTATTLDGVSIDIDYFNASRAKSFSVFAPGEPGLIPAPPVEPVGKVLGGDGVWVDLRYFSRGSTYLKTFNNKSIPDVTETPLAFDRRLEGTFDHNDFPSFWNYDEPTLIKIKESSAYTISINLKWAADASGVRKAVVKHQNVKGVPFILPDTFTNNRMKVSSDGSTLIMWNDTDLIIYSNNFETINTYSTDNVRFTPYLSVDGTVIYFIAADEKLYSRSGANWGTKTMLKDLTGVPCTVFNISENGAVFTLLDTTANGGKGRSTLYYGGGYSSTKIFDGTAAPTEIVVTQSVINDAGTVVVHLYNETSGLNFFWRFLIWSGAGFGTTNTTTISEPFFRFASPAGFLRMAGDGSAIYYVCRGEHDGFGPPLYGEGYIGAVAKWSGATFSSFSSISLAEGGDGSNCNLQNLNITTNGSRFILYSPFYSSTRDFDTTQFVGASPSIVIKEGAGYADEISYRERDFLDILKAAPLNVSFGSLLFVNNAGNRRIFTLNSPTESFALVFDNVGGVEEIGYSQIPGNAQAISQNMTVVRYLNAGDVITLECYQNSGNALNILPGSSLGIAGNFPGYEGTGRDWV
jgi:hypothetical protein